jgi:hypothetical protein
MPRLFVGLHAALIAIIALFGLTFLLDPCGGGGDLCLGGAIGVGAFGVAALGGLGIAIWLGGRRASPLLVLDSLLAVVGAAILFEVASYGPLQIALGALSIAALGLSAAALAGRAVAPHRIERLVAVAGLVGVAVLVGGGEGGIAIVALGLLALGAGWLSARPRPAPG